MAEAHTAMVYYFYYQEEIDREIRLESEEAEAEKFLGATTSVRARRESSIGLTIKVDYAVPLQVQRFPLL